MARTKINEEEYNKTVKSTTDGFSGISYRPKNPKKSDIENFNAVCSRLHDKVMMQKSKAVETWFFSFLNISGTSQEITRVF